MQKIFNIKFKSIVIVYLLSFSLNLIGSNSIIYFTFENFLFPSVQKISEFFLNKSEQENLSFTLVKNGVLESEKSEILISSENFPFEIPYENIIFISNEANLDTLRSKKALLALNNNKIFSELDGESFVIDIWEQFPNLDRVTINSQSILSVKNWINENKNLQALVLIGANTLTTVLSLLTYFLIGYFLLRLLVSYIFKFTKTNFSDQALKVTSVMFLSIFNVLEPVLKIISVTFSLPFPDIISFSVIGLIFILFFGTRFPKQEA